MADRQEEPAHTDGQGEICDSSCPHWQWADRREEPATEAGDDLDRTLGGRYRKQIIAIEREARSLPAPLDVELRHVIETWDEVIGGVYSVTDDHLSVMADALEPIRARLSAQPSTEPAQGGERE